MGEDRLSILNPLTWQPARAVALAQRTEIMEKGAKGEEEDWNLGVRRLSLAPYTGELRRDAPRCAFLSCNRCESLMPD